MNQLFRGLGALALLGIFSLGLQDQSQAQGQGQTGAQAGTDAVRPVGPFSYDAPKETTISGKISSVITRPAAGMVWGAHIMVETPAGTVDASLGTLLMRGKNPPSFVEGEQVEVTGEMKTLNNQQVFLARMVKVEGRAYMIRNVNGFPLRDKEDSGESRAGVRKDVQP